MSELVALAERLSRSAKGLLVEATVDHLLLLQNTPNAELNEAFEAATGAQKSDAQLDALKSMCELELKRREKLEAMDTLFHEGEGAEDHVDPFKVAAGGAKGIDYDKVRRVGGVVCGYVCSDFFRS